jgi:hypothetical protein
VTTSSFERKKAQARRRLQPGQTTFITHGGITYPVYRAPKKAGDQDHS